MCNPAAFASWICFQQATVPSHGRIRRYRGSGVIFRRLKGLEGHGFDGFVDFDCGTLLPSTMARALSQYMRGVCTESSESFLDRLALDMYGPKARSAIREGWDACEQAIRSYPLDMLSPITDCLVGRMGLSMSLTIAMVPDIALFAGKDYHTDPHWMYPYSVLAGDVIEAQEKQFSLVVDQMQRTADLLYQFN